MTDRTHGPLPLRAMGLAAVLAALAVVIAIVGLNLALPDDADPQVAASTPAPVASTGAGWLAIGLEQYGAGDLAGAEASFGTAVRLDPGDSLAVFNLGTIRDAQGDPTGARDLYARAVSLDPEFVDAHFNLAVARAVLGDTEGAKRAYRAVLGLDPDHAAASWNLGLLLYEEGDIGSARVHLNRAVELDSSFLDRVPEGVKLG